MYYKKDYDYKYITSDEILDNITNPDKPIRKLYYAVMVIYFINLGLLLAQIIF